MGASFTCEVVDARGRRARRVEQAATAEAARQSLEAEHLVVLEVTPASGGAARTPGSGRAVGRDVLELTRATAGLLGAGLPLARALGAATTLLSPAGAALADELRYRVERGTPLSPDTVFDVASMTKQFTGATAGLLSLEHKVALTDDVRARFPELPIDVPVTIDDLLHHTSGLRDYAELNQLRGREATDNEAVLTLLARQKSLNFAPGSESAYSNSNYVVLAELVQRASGKSLAALAQERIFAPLKMGSTRYGGRVQDDPANLANSYAPSAPGQFVPITRASQSVGDGNLLTAHQGDADDREKDRDPQDQHAIHSRNPPQTGTGT